MKRRDLLTLSLGLAAVPTLAKASEPSSSSADTSSFTPMAILTATLIRSNGRRGVLSVETGLDVPDAAFRERVVQAIPRLRAAHSQIVRAFGAALLSSEVPDADRLARELQAATDETLGRTGARLLIGTILTS